VVGLARGLAKLDVIPAVEAEGRSWKFVGIWAKNRREWLETLLASQHLEGTVVGLYDAMGPIEVEYILNQTELPIMFAASAYVDKILAMKKDGQASKVKTLVSFDSVTDAQIAIASEIGVQLLRYQEDLIQVGSESSDLELSVPKSSDIYLMSYTSGTTGDPKGVKISHKMAIHSAEGLSDLLNLNESDSHLSYLPYVHVFEQAMLASSMIKGSTFGYYSGNPKLLTEDMQNLKATIFPGVPRVHNIIHDKLRAGFAALEGPTGEFVKGAVATKLAALKENGALTHEKFDAAFAKPRALLGGKVRLIISAAAPIDSVVMDFLKIVFGCPMLEAYGMTELGGATHATDPTDFKTGQVGGPIHSIAQKLKDVPEMDYYVTDQPYPRGELLVASPQVTTGYFKRQDKTDEAIIDGWYHSGDVVEMFPNGSVRIIDRAKNIFKLSQGEYIAPQKMDNIFALSPLIAQCMVYGDSLKDFVVAVVVPDVAAVEAWVQENKFGDFEIEDVIITDELKTALMASMTQLADENKLSRLERPRYIHVTLDAFTVENGILTPTMKLKRNKGRDHFAA